MMARASAERADRAGRDHLHGDVAERGRFGRAGEHRPAGGVGRELGEQAFLEPPPTMRIVRNVRPLTSSSASSTSRYLSARLSRMARV